MSEAAANQAAPTSGYADCYNKALDLLARRSHFERELERKLRTRGFDGEYIERTFEALRANGLLDDAEVARRFVEQRRRSRREVGVRLEQELRKRGVDPDLASRTVASMDRGGDLDLAREVARSQAARGASRERIGRHLQRKGFGQAVILESLESIVRRGPSD